MNKRPLCGCAVMYGCGIWAASVRAWYGYVIAAAALILVLYSFFLHFSRLRRAWFMIFLFSFFLIFGCLAYQQADDNSRWYEAYDLDDSNVTVTGTVYAIEEDDDSRSVFLKNAEVSGGGCTYAANRILIRTYTQDAADEIQIYDQIRIGNRIRVEGIVSYFSEARNPGNFDARSYYRSKQIDFRVTPDRITITDSSVFSYEDILYRFKKRVRHVLENCLTEDAYGTLCTMVLGDDSDLSDETEQLYQEAGFSHILAISGLHVSVVGMLLYRRMRKAGCSYLISTIPAAFLVLSYGMISGMGIAVRRAMIMFAVLLIANLFGFAYDSLSALSLAALIILVKNPLLLFTASFQLSFCAVPGASVVFPVLKEYFHADNRFAENFLISFSIQLMTIPVTLYYYYEVPVFSLAANFIMLPFVSVLLADGIIGGIIGLVSMPIAGAVLMPGALILEGYTFICTLIAKIPGHMLVCGRPAQSRIIIYYLILAAVLVRMNRKPMRRIVSGLMHGAVLILVLMALMILRVPTSFQITMLDVGQGEGILVETGGVSVFIDGGSSDVTDVGKWRVGPYLKYRGIRNIDLWMVSHADSDHISALEELLEDGYQIDLLAVAAGACQDETLSDLVTLAQECGTRVIFPGQGSTIEQGEAQWTLLYPEDENGYTDLNEASMVLLLRYGEFTALFTGDITEETEEDILSDRVFEKYMSSRERADGIDLLKAAHHGSKYSSSEAFLEAVSPKAAIISAGVNNLYGHPSEETLIRLREYTDEIYVTADNGAIMITISQDFKMQTETFLGQQ